VAKGSGFERQLCKMLSTWISEGKTDDVFWRTAGSGGRATVRAKKNKESARSMHGDILANATGDAALDLLAKQFLEIVTIEAKAGYSNATPYQVFDKRPTAKLQTWETFFVQAARECTQAKTFGWLIISKRNLAQEVVWMPDNVLKLLRKVEPSFGVRTPTMSVSTRCRTKAGATVPIAATAVSLVHFLRQPPHIWAQAHAEIS
jgi:hypothetical protein